MEACDAYIGSTPGLVEHARRVVGIDAHLFENGVGVAIGVASDIALRRPRSPGPLRVGYFSGTTTHDADWRHIERSVIEVLEAHPDAELWLGGHLTPTEAVIGRLGDRVRRLPFTAWHRLPALLRDLDVNLAPLEPGSRFNDAKSAIKWLEAALVSTPTIASPSAPFRDAIEDGHTGWLADDPADWATMLERALQDGDLRTLVGARARRGRAPALVTAPAGRPLPADPGPGARPPEQPSAPRERRGRRLRRTPAARSHPARGLPGADRGIDRLARAPHPAANPPATPPHEGGRRPPFGRR